jgi:hypothetical protein
VRREVESAKAPSSSIAIVAAFTAVATAVGVQQFRQQTAERAIWPRGATVPNLVPLTSWLP